MRSRQSQQEELEKAVALTRAEEKRVKNDPNSTPEKKIAAKEARKTAEFQATMNDEQLQRHVEEAEKRQQDKQTTGQGGDKEKRIYLSVPFVQKDEAKALGARWDRNEKAWYIPPGVDPSVFAAWIDTGEPQVPEPKEKGKREYLAVPFGERHAVKAAGALWDKEAKSWYIGPKADLDLLKRWRPEGIPNLQSPAMAPKEEFSELLRSIGCVVSGEHPIMDGKKHRISVVGEKFSGKAGAGFYVAHLDGHPAGYAKNNKTGIETKWKAKGYTLDEEQKVQMQNIAAEKLQARELEQERIYEQTAVRLNKELFARLPVVEPTPYMKAKGVVPQKGVYTDGEGQETIIPAIDAKGKQWTVQYVHPDGTKRFAKDSRKEGCFHAIGGLDALAKAPVLVIGEGYATASSLSQALGYSTVAAFDSGNVPSVAKDLHEKFPDKPILIAGDDDRHLEMSLGYNPGRKHAEEAAKAVGGVVVFPIFAPSEQTYPPELDRVTPEQYRNKTISDQQSAALERMKQFTDFNDLAEKSSLGEEGVMRQVSPAIDKAIEKHKELSLKNQQELDNQQRRSIKIG
ncbi:MAG: DUF5710 domain-containing protein, partial [Alphaproteobacteria bacterium]|nr:DUF5710 domain-containing protein [Alphaproteobacteria bacterium]